MKSTISLVSVSAALFIAPVCANAQGPQQLQYPGPQTTYPQPGTFPQQGTFPSPAQQQQQPMQQQLGQLPPGVTLTCRFTYGPAMGQTRNFMGVPGANPGLVGGPCSDGAGSVGVGVPQQ